MNKKFVLLKISVALAVMVIFGSGKTVIGQTVLASEDFETGGSTLFSITHDYGTHEITSTYANTGSYGFGYWCQGVEGIQTASLETAPINTEGYSNIAMTFPVMGAGGMDIGDYAEVYISPDNGANWYLRLHLNGDGTPWTYASGTGEASAVYAAENITIPSHTSTGILLYGRMTITDLPLVQQLRVRIVFGNETGGSERWGFDDFVITGDATTPLYTGAVAGSPFCVSNSAGTPVTVSWSSEAAFTSNTFTAQLSDASGSFLSPTVIGTLVSNESSGSMSATIPAGTPTGTDYRIRVTSSNPVIIGSDNGSDLTVNLEANSIAPAGVQNIVFGQEATMLTVTEQSAPVSREWYYSTAAGGPYSVTTGVTTSTYTPDFDLPGTYYVVCISVFPCGTVTSNEVQVNLLASVATGTLSGAPYCVTATAGEGVQVPFTSVGLFTSNTYTAQLSDAAGSFAIPVSIGILVSNDNSGIIDALIPANTPSGTGYKIRVISSSPVLTGTESSEFEIVNGISNVTAPAADPQYTSVILTWTDPVNCYNEVMIVAREGSAATSVPSGDGSQYSAGNIFGTGSAFDGGYIVCKGVLSPETVTGLTNGETYYFTFFTRNGDEWSTGTSVSAVPVAVPANARWAVANGPWSSPDTWSDESGGAPGASVPGTGANVFIDSYCQISAVPDITLSSLKVSDMCNLDGGTTITVTTSLEVSTGAILTLGYDVSGMNLILASTAAGSIDGMVTWSYGDLTSWTFTNNGLLRVGPTGRIRKANGSSDRSAFVNNPEAVLRIGSPSGITLTDPTAGNILTYTRSYSPAANYVYEGAGVQSTGNGLPLVTTGNITVAAGTTLTPNHGSGSTLSNSGVITINGALTVPSGYTLESTGSGSIIINSDIVNSGSLVMGGTVNAEGRVTYNRTIPDDGATQLWHYMSSPVSPTGIATEKVFYPYDEVLGDWGSITSTIESGRGYTIIGGGSVSYTGSLVTSDFGITATSPYSSPFEGLDYSSRPLESGRSYGAGGWNLFGNPYPSAMSVEAFIDANYNADWNYSSFDPNYVALYLYNGSTYQYVTRDETGWSTEWPNGDYLDAAYIQAGQGFFVLAMNDGAEFNFSRSMQAHSTGSVLLKSRSQGDRWPGLSLKVSNGEVERRTVVVFNQDMTTGLDPIYDVGLMSSGREIELYTALVKDNGVNFTRQALSPDGIVKEVIPVGLDYGSGGKVTFSADIESLRSYRYWLEDRVTGVMTDLGSDSYSVEVPAKTYGTGRFFIHVAAGRSVRPRAVQEHLFDMRIWATGDRKVVIQGTVSEGSVCEVYSIQGQKLLEVKLEEGDYNMISIPGSRSGVFLVKVTDGVKTVTQRVVLLK